MGLRTIVWSFAVAAVSAVMTGISGASHFPTADGNSNPINPSDAFAQNEDLSSGIQSKKPEPNSEFGTYTDQPINADPQKIGIYTRNVSGNGPGLFALLIGINSYNGAKSTASRAHKPQSGATEYSEVPTFNNLRGAVADAQQFEEYLTKDLMVPKEHIHFLRDGQATRAAIMGAIKTFRDDDNIKRDDVIFIFYAGHGAQALPPKRLLDTKGCPDYVELLIPHDYTSDPANHEYMGIPDFTLATLLDQISEKKGNNITVIFDCCHSAGALRGSKSEGKDVDSQYITRSGPELHYHVPDDLDQDIRQHTMSGMRGMKIVPTLNHLGTKSYVFFSACKSTERARETNKQGCFTTTLLALLKKPGAPTISCTQIITRLDKIDGQSPQCEGDLQDSRPVFHSYVPSHKRNFFNVRDTKMSSKKTTFPKTFIVEAGDILGLSQNDELTIYKSKLEIDHSEPVGTIILNEVLSDHSKAIIKTNTPSFSLPYNPSPALLTKRAPVVTPYHDNASNRLNLFIDIDNSELKSHVRNIDSAVHIVPDVDFAHIHLSIGKKDSDDTPRLKFVVVDKDLVRDNVKLQPNFADMDDKEGLRRILDGLSHYYSHLKRTSKNTALTEKISVSFFKLKDTFDGQPRFTVADGSENLRANNTIQVTISNDNADDDEEDPEIYGMEVTNNTGKGGNLFPVLFYFDNNDFTISLHYHHPFGGHSPESPWPANTQSMTIGYGVGPGSTVAPFSFYMNDGHDMEAGFFKLVFSNKPIDLSNIVQDVSPFHNTRAISQKSPRKRPPQDPHCWGSITLPIIQRRAQSSA